MEYDLWFELFGSDAMLTEQESGISIEDQYMHFLSNDCCGDYDYSDLSIESWKAYANL